MTIEPTEAVAFTIIAFGYLPIILAYIRRSHVRWLLFAYTALVVGGAATLLEGFFLPDLLNVVEHGIGVMGAGLLFALTAYFSMDRIETLRREIASDFGDAHGE